MKNMKRIVGALSAFCALSSVAVTVETKTKDPAVTFAAQELTRILGARADQITLREDRTLPAQAWHLQSDSAGTLVISGRDGMGLLYGTCSFLEKYAGVRWFAPDTEVLSDLTGWTLPANLDETKKPAFDYREMYVGHDFMDSLWRVRNKETNRASFGCGVLNGSPGDCHTFAAYAKALKAKHPELFGTRISAGGQICSDLCMTDEATRDFVADEICRHIEADAAKGVGKPLYTVPTFYDLSQNDGGSSCECMCPGCQKLYEEAGNTYAGPNIAFVSAVAERVRKRHPEVTIQTFAYSYTQEPPTNAVVAADNVNVRYCCSWVFDPLVKGSPQGEKLERWAEHARQFGIWSYWRTYRGILFPFVKKRQEISDELRFCRSLGTSRYYCENEAPLSRSFAMLQHWLFLKMSEDPSQDVFALSREFLKGYYGKAAEPVGKYLDYLEKRQKSGVGCLDNPQRAHLDRAFFEKVNAWLDEAEALVKDDPRSLQHVHWERVVVDRSMYDGLGALQKEGFSYDNAAVVRRFRANAREQLETWSELQVAVRKDQKERRLKEIDGEVDLYAHYPVPMPDEFDGLDVETVEWNKLVPGGAEVVKDAAAAAGTAFFDPKFAYKLPFSLGYYNGDLLEGASVGFTSQDDVPQDEKFHLYKIGKAWIQSPLYFHLSDWSFRRYVGTLGIVPERREIWISLKFQGPAFVTGSTARNAVLIDRAFYVKNDDPMRGYEKAGEDLVPADRKTLTVSSPDGSYKEAHVWLEDPAKMDYGLLVRGTCDWKNVKAADGKKVHHPFVGLWAITQKGGRNSFTYPCVEFYPGDYANQPFEAVLEADRLRRFVSQAGEPVTLTFRINLVAQPATVTVRDLQIVPVRRKAKGPVGAAKYDKAMAQEKVIDADGLTWIDGTKLPIEGRAFDDTEHYYDRLPSNVTAAVNAGVRNMKHHTSGLQFRFTTDSRKLRFRWSVYDPKQLEMQHMPRTGVSGIDVYRQRADGKWLFERSGCPAMYTAKDGDTFEFEMAWTPGTPCLVNLPLYNGIRTFSLGLEQGKTVKPLPPRKSGVTKPVVFYGTSITHGGCCSRPGMAFPSIVGRQLDVPIVNLGFSGSGRMEFEMSEHLAKIDASCYVLDCLWNMGGKRWVEEKHRERYEPFIRNLRAKRPGVPIVMAEHCDVYCKGPDERDRFIKELYDKLIAEGWDNLVYLPNKDMYPDDLEGTVDGAHASDYGMLSLAKAFGGAVAEALKLKK